MCNRTKKWLLVTAVLMILGFMLFAGAMTSLGWDFSGLTTVAWESNTYPLSEGFRDISVETDTANIRFVPSEDGGCKVVCREETNARHTVEVRDGRLTIRIEDRRKWYEHIGIGFDTPQITVCIPAGAYGSLSVKGSTGDVELPENFSFGDIGIRLSTGDIVAGACATGDIRLTTGTGDIRLEKVTAGAAYITATTGRITVSGLDCSGVLEVNVSTGRSELTDIRCESFRSTASTGDLRMKNLTAAESISIRRSTGKVIFDGCDAADITVETDTGDVSGTLLSDKQFKTKTVTGNIRVPDTVSGGNCHVTTSTGDITLDIL